MNTSASARAATLLAASLAVSPAFAQAPATARSPVTHEALWTLKRVGPPVVSPDGKWVAVSVTEPAYDEKKEVADLWIVPADGSAPRRRLTSGKGGESGAACSGCR